MEHIQKRLEFKQKTEKLLRRLNLRPKPYESVYSQSYIARQRDINKRIKQASEEQIKI